MTITLRRNGLRCLAAAMPTASINKHFPFLPPYPIATIAFELDRIEREAHKMASKNRTSAPPWNKTEFVNISLDVEEGKKFRLWFEAQGEKIADLLGEVVVDDYKISCSWDDTNQCFIGTFTGKEDQRFNAYKALSSRSDEWYEALSITLYKHLVMSKSGAWAGATQKNNWG